ncbi:MAG: (d)CMP kinase [Proteobacteria bacterium]|nr:(d)CMP kinase [Pseudomonadota bacterium]
MNPIPVIAIDGPASSGKGTIAVRVARFLGFHYLDSGALYRLVALVALREGLTIQEAGRLKTVAETLDARFEKGEIYLGQDRVTSAIRKEEVGRMASQVATVPAVRTGLLAWQRGFRQLPGLVCDGRDMGSVVFPDALLKIYLTASREIRAKRRYNQLMGKEKGVKIEEVLADLDERDARDVARAVAPLSQATDAVLLDTSDLSIDEVVQAVLRRYEKVKPR